MAYTDPRQLDPDAYKFQSKFERYRTLRTYYDRVCARFEAMLDHATWSDADSRRLEALSSYFSNEIRLKVDASRQYWHPSRAISEEEEWEALDRCTPEDVAHACIHNFAIKAFQHYGMDYDAYMLINRGFAAFRPQEDSYSKCCPTSFLAFLTSNAKFESYAESDLFLSGSTFRTRGHWDSARQDGYVLPTNA